MGWRSKPKIGRKEVHDTDDPRPHLEFERPNTCRRSIMCRFHYRPHSLLLLHVAGWPLGAVMCKATPFLQGVAVSASVSTLTAIAFDRWLYFAV